MTGHHILTVSATCNSLHQPSLLPPVVQALASCQAVRPVMPVPASLLPDGAKGLVFGESCHHKKLLNGCIFAAATLGRYKRMPSKGFPGAAKPQQFAMLPTMVASSTLLCSGLRSVYMKQAHGAAQSTVLRLLGVRFFRCLSSEPRSLLRHAWSWALGSSMCACVHWSCRLTWQARHPRHAVA